MSKCYSCTVFASFNEWGNYDPDTAGYEDYLDNSSCLHLCDNLMECGCDHSCRFCGSLHSSGPCRE